jgi:biotin transporter BioY
VKNVFEILNTLIQNAPTALIVAITVGFIRNIAGWLENSWKDGKVTEYEFKQLGGTIVKYFAGIMILMLGLPLEESIVGAFVLDIGASAIKNRGTR